MINKVLLMEFFKDDDIKVVDKDFYIKSQMKRDVIKYITILEEENQRLKKLCDKYEEKKIPEKLKWNEKSQHNVVTDNTKKTLEHLLSRSEQLKKSINEIIDYLKSKGE